MQRVMVRCGVMCALVALAVLCVPGSASAHERRDLQGGKYQAVVGFLSEPAFEGSVNGLDLTVTDKTKKTADGKDTPVEGLEKTLKAEVLVPNGAKKDIEIKTRFDMPGKYAAYFVPTAPGTYIYHITGTINEQKIDEKFESGPGRFNDVEPLAAYQFPNKVSVPADVQAQLDSAQSAANTGRALGIGGLAVGILGLAVGGFALARRPATKPAPEQSPRP